MRALFSGIVSLLLMLLLPALAQTNSRSAQTPVTQSVIDANDILPRETFVPFTRQGNLLLVNGSINGKRTPMVFDTGAGGCLFSIETLKNLGIAIPEHLQAALVAGVGSKQQTKAWVMPVDLKLGSIERRHFLVHINDNPLNMPLLGVNFLQGFEYTINTDSNIIQFKLLNKEKAKTNSAAPQPRGPKYTMFKLDAKSVRDLKAKSAEAENKENGSDSEIIARISRLTSKPVITVDSQCRYVYTVPFTEFRGAIIVMVEIDGRRCPMILDTGTNLCVFNRTHIKQLGIAPQPTGQTLNAKGAAGYLQAPLCFYGNAKFGPIEDRLVCLVTDEGFMPRPLLGQNFFGKWELTVDHENNVIRFRHK
jgi:predicted aspartyl protease